MLVRLSPALHRCYCISLRLGRVDNLEQVHYLERLIEDASRSRQLLERFAEVVEIQDLYYVIFGLTLREDARTKPPG
jgi:hypothetical protein